MGRFYVQWTDISEEILANVLSLAVCSVLELCSFVSHKNFDSDCVMFTKNIINEVVCHGSNGS